MANQLQVFKEQEVLGKEFRIYGDVDNPLFLAKDVAEWIGHSNVSKMIKDADLSDEDLTKITTSYNGDGSKVLPPSTSLFVTEDGLYEILMQSRKPIAKEFKKEVKQILKSIRKHGAYMTENVLEQAILNPDFAIGLITSLKEEQEKRKKLELENQEKQRLLEEQKPKVEFANRLLESKDTLLVREFSKILQKEGFELGEKKLFDWLRVNGILDSSNMPYQCFMKYFQVIERVFDIGYDIKISYTTKINPNGQLYIFKRLQKEINEKGELNLRNLVTA